MSKVERQMPRLRVPEWLQNELARHARKGFQLGISKALRVDLPIVLFPSCLSQTRILNLDTLRCQMQTPVLATHRNSFCRHSETRDQRDICFNFETR